MSRPRVSDLPFHRNDVPRICPLVQRIVADDGARLGLLA
jgi:hypothetical protein